jgi:hypothetical protein
MSIVLLYNGEDRGSVKWEVQCILCPDTLFGINSLSVLGEHYVDFMGMHIAGILSYDEVTVLKLRYGDICSLEHNGCFKFIIIGRV